MRKKLFNNENKTIGLLTNNLSVSYNTIFWKRINKLCIQKGYNLIIFPLNYSKSEEEVFRQSIYSFINSNNIDALILLSNTLNIMQKVSELEELVKSFTDIPVVSCGIKIFNADASVIANQEVGFVRLLEFLIVDRGIRKFSFLKGNEEHEHTIERLSIFNKVLGEHGISCPEELIIKGDFFPDSGINAVEELIDVKGIIPEAIICCNDDMAIGVMQALKKRGIRVPEDILVTGYDNIPELSREASTLATVKQPVSEMADRTIDVVEGLINKSIEGGIFELETEFIWRKSAGGDSSFVISDFENEPDPYSYLLDTRMMQRLTVEGVYEFMKAESIDDLITALKTEFPRIGIKTFYIGIYGKENPFISVEKAGLLEFPKTIGYLYGMDMDYNIEVSKKIDSSLILPESISINDKRKTMILEPLFQADEAYGYAFYELGPKAGAFYETIRQQLSSAFKVIYLLGYQKSINIELNKTVDNLNATRKQLIESEKMSALGTLVAGVAHEINTPVGVSVSAASFLSLEAEKISEHINNGKLSRKEFELFIEELRKSCDILLTNLDKASQLIKSFKNIAVDQTNEDYRDFNIREYLNQIILSLHPKLKKKDIKIDIICDERLSILSYPGAFSQIMTNFIMNSIIHGFYEREAGKIFIKVIEVGNNIEISYRDDGCGIKEEDVLKIFDPFFTTKRGEGGAGLGLHIVYNLVTHKLKGSINCSSKEGEGTEFSIVFPRNNTEDKVK